MTEPAVQYRWKCATCGEKGEGHHGYCPGLMPAKLCINILPKERGWLVETVVESDWTNAQREKADFATYEEAFAWTQVFMHGAAVQLRRALDLRNDRDDD